MNKERILPYCKSQELTDEELLAVSGGTNSSEQKIYTVNCIFTNKVGHDMQCDAIDDI